MDASRFAGAVRRQWWVVALLAVLGVAGGYGLARLTPAVYTATTYVLVSPATPGAAAPNPDTEAELVTSTGVATAAATQLNAAVDVTRVHVSVPSGSDVLAIAYDAPTAVQARDGSHAFAAAYLAQRLATAKSALSTQVSALNATLKKRQSSLTQAEATLAALSPNDGQYAAAAASRDDLANQVSALTTRLDDLSTTTVTPGSIVTDARVPASPSRPSRTLLMTYGGLIGLAVGLVLAALRQRAGRRIHGAAEVAYRSGLPLLASLPDRTGLEILMPHTAGGRTYQRLHNEIAASEAMRGGISSPDGTRVILVAGASRGPVATVVAANLATALARTGCETVLVSSHAPETMGRVAPLGALVGVAATPGLSDVLTGAVSLRTAVQHAPREPRLRVLTPGGAASAAGTLRSRAWRDTLDSLMEQAEYVVIDASSTATSADAQSLASAADIALVTVELGVTTRAELRDAAHQLRPVTAGTVGVVVLPRLKRVRAQEAEPAPTEMVGWPESARWVEPPSSSPRAMSEAPRPRREHEAAAPGEPEPPNAGANRRMNAARQEAMRNQSRRPSTPRPAVPVPPPAPAATEAHAPKARPASGGPAAAPARPMPPGPTAAPERPMPAGPTTGPARPMPAGPTTGPARSMPPGPARPVSPGPATARPMPPGPSAAGAPVPTPAPARPMPPGPASAPARPMPPAPITGPARPMSAGPAVPARPMPPGPSAFRVSDEAGEATTAHVPVVTPPWPATAQVPAQEQPTVPRISLVYLETTLDGGKK